ncbi:MAG TPA: oligosaccharide flippase family protein [Gaiellaceae bacterium]|nr:oligosaccharide flippase family protein [Gaiellaceae bacterium]
MEPQAPRVHGRAFASAAAATFATNMVAAALSLANVLITARQLGPSGRGELAFLTTVAMLTAALSSLGIEEAHGNMAATMPRARRALGGNSVAFALALGALAACVVALLMLLLPGVAAGSDPRLRIVALVAIPVLLVQLYLQFLVRADYGFAIANVATLAAVLLNFVANALLALLGLITVQTALVAWVAGQLVGAAILAWYVRRRLAGFGRPDRALARDAFGFGLRAHGGRVMKTSNYRLDQWLLGSIAGTRELGLYSVAVAWAEALFYLPEALGMVMRPDVARASASEAGRRVAVVFRVALLITIPVVVVLIVAAPILCVTVFGEEFRGSIDDLRVLAPGAFGITALKLFGNALTAQRRPMLANAAIAVAFGATIALDLLLIPRHGGLGAALASTLAYTAGGIAVAAIFGRTLRVRGADFVPRLGDIRQLAASLRARGRAGPAAPSDEELRSPPGFVD